MISRRILERALGDVGGRGWHLYQKGALGPSSNDIGRILNESGRGGSSSRTYSASKVPEKGGVLPTSGLKLSKVSLTVY